MAASYDNCRLISPSGELLSYTSNRRGEWYLRKGLGKKVNDKPLAVQLLFTPNIKTRLIDEDPFYNQELPSHCVVCGEVNELTQHHCVPSNYRKHFPFEYKAYNHHDVLLLCGPCHRTYEKEAHLFKLKLINEFNISKTTRDNTKRIKRLAQTLIENSLPEDRRLVLITYLEQEVGRSPITLSDLEQFSNLKIITKTKKFKKKISTVGKLIVEKLESIPDFIRLWRKHFVETMNPQFLPLYWSIERVRLATSRFEKYD